jgi:cytidine deaminase
MDEVKPLNDSERAQLLRAASEVAAKAYAPYSNFRVGAAVLGEKGIHAGANVENASYGLALCAERAALSAAIAGGEKNFRALAIACLDASAKTELSERMPCGACRQWILELAPKAEILIFGFDQQFRMEDLLPNPFERRTS